MQNFTFTTDDLNYQLSTGSVTTHVKVKGFWSSSQMTSYIRFSNDGQYTIEITTSSGGRYPKEVESDVEAYTNFANALLALTEYTESLIKEQNLVECYQTIRNERAEKYERERKEAQALIASKLEGTTPFDEKLANSVLKYIRENGSLNVIQRLSGETVTISRASNSKYVMTKTNCISVSKSKSDILNTLVDGYNVDQNKF